MCYPSRPAVDKKEVLAVKPPFTLGEIKKAIPPHCFERPLRHSLSILGLDLVIIFTFFHVATNYINLLPLALQNLAWTIYAVLQGIALTRPWILAHECGHHAFSDYEWLDDAVGFILHTTLLVPYFSFKYSHRRHHSNTGSLEREEVNTPIFKSQVPSYFKYLNNAPCRLIVLTFLLTFGLPLYLCLNFRGRKYDRFTNHFDAYGPIFSVRQHTQILISDVGILAMFLGLYLLSVQKGFSWVFLVYGGPSIVLAVIVMLLTVLNHTHPSVPFYDSSEWEWLRGALATVDRDFGILNWVFHNGTNTHVAHHLFTKMPFYHAEEATRAFKPILGDYYQFDDTPIHKAIWTVAKECVYVEPDEGDGQNKGIYWFKNQGLN